jgi:glycosyltransferase involved in cell wall biosynthesis
MLQLRTAVESVAHMDNRISVIIAALNEEATIGSVVRELHREVGALMRECIVVDNGSTDNTRGVAASAGARVVSEPRRGYGRACATGVEHADRQSRVLVFLDGDGSDVPAEIPALASRIIQGSHDFAIGSRIRGKRDPGSLLVSQVFAAWLSGAVIRLRYHVRYTDMGPLRAISRDALARMRMKEMTYGWNLEMQMKAAAMKLRTVELPVAYRCRQGGESKVAGSLRGSIKAASRITGVMLRLALAARQTS